MKIFEIENKEKYDHGKIVNINDFTDDQILKIIKKRCPTICRAIKETKKFLYRGVLNIDKKMIIGLTPINRRSIGVYKFISYDVDNQLKIHGFKARRSNSIFCTSDFDTTKIFGWAYYIFPIDPIDFTWSPIIYDLNLSKDKFPFWEKYYHKEISIEKLFEESKYTNTNFNTALESGHEIMIRGKYIGVSFNDIPQFNDFLLRNL